MDYFLSRNNEQFGPYSLTDLQRWLAEGRVAAADLVRSEGMTDWVPLSGVLGDVPVAPPLPAAPLFGYGGLSSAPAVDPGPPPPSLHWGIVLLLGICTLGIFGLIWGFIQAAWIRKVDRSSKAIYLMLLYLLLYFGGVMLSGMQEALGEAAALLGALLMLAGAVCLIASYFSMRSSVEEYASERLGVRLEMSGVVTFFFNVYYIQYHLTKLREIRRAAARASA